MKTIKISRNFFVFLFAIILQLLVINAVCANNEINVTGDIQFEFNEQNDIVKAELANDDRTAAIESYQLDFSVIGDDVYTLIGEKVNVTGTLNKTDNGPVLKISKYSIVEYAPSPVKRKIQNDLTKAKTIE